MVVTLDELKTHLRILDFEENDYLEGLIRQAQAAAEDYCRVEFGANVEAGQPLPEPVRLAILLFASFYYENRDMPDRTAYGTMRIAFQNLLYPYRDPQKLF